MRRISGRGRTVCVAADIIAGHTKEPERASWCDQRSKFRVAFALTCGRPHSPFDYPDLDTSIRAGLSSGPARAGINHVGTVRFSGSLGEPGRDLPQRRFRHEAGTHRGRNRRLELIRRPRRQRRAPPREARPRARLLQLLERAPRRRDGHHHSRRPRDRRHPHQRRPHSSSSAVRTRRPATSAAT